VQALGGLGRTMQCKNQLGHFVWLPMIHCFAHERKHYLQCLIAHSEPFHATLTLFGCNTGQQSGNLFLEEVNIPSTWHTKLNDLKLSVHHGYGCITSYPQKPTAHDASQVHQRSGISTTSQNITGLE
jgi:hypothetical protein